MLKLEDFRVPYRVGNPSREHHLAVWDIQRQQGLRQDPFRHGRGGGRWSGQMDIPAQGGLEAMRGGKAMLDRHGIEVDWDRRVARHISNGRRLIGSPPAFGQIHRIISRRYCAALTPKNRAKQKSMSNHALTVYRSHKLEEETVHVVGRSITKNLSRKDPRHENLG